MATSCSVVTPEKYRVYLEETPQELGKFDTAYGQYVADHHSPDVAGRIEECGTIIRKHKDARGHVWVTTHYCEKKSCQTCANRIAERELAKYSVLDKETFSACTYLEYDRAAGAKVRKALRRMGQTLAISKEGWRHDRWTCGTILLAPPEAIPERVLRRLYSLDPLLEIVRHERNQFLALLNKLLHPVMPEDFAERLSMESKDGKRRRQIFFQGASNEKRRTLFVSEESNTDNVPKDSSKKHACCCPRCGLPEISRTLRMPIGSLLKDEHWIPVEPDPPPGEFLPENLY